MNKDYALIIGIKDYSDLKDLNGPVNDAANFKNWVRAAEGGNVPSENIHLITSKVDPYRPLQDDIDEKLKLIYNQGKVTGYRRFYFYFAGHGFGASWNENALCLPKWSSFFRNYALSSSEYLKLIVESGVFDEVFFFLDCCRNRSIGSKPARPYINWVKPGDGASECSSFVAYGSTFYNSSYEASTIHNGDIQVQGHFTKALIEGLNGAAVDRSNGQITTDSLKSFLTKRVKEVSNLKQKARFEDGFTVPSIIKLTEEPKHINLKLTFNEEGNIELYDPNLEIIEAKHSSEWPEFIALPKGLYEVINTSTNQNAIIKLDIKFNEDMTLKHLAYEL